MYLLVAHIYWKDRASIGAGGKIVCKPWIRRGKWRLGSVPYYPPELPERPLF
jgi:hypothetical protein